MIAATPWRERLHGLYLVTDDAPLDDQRIAQITSMIADGLPVLQYRRKSIPKETATVEAGKLVELCRAAETLFIINDDIKLAHMIGAHGVHLGEEDESIAAARKILGSDCLVGKSCYASLDHARDAATGGADYIAFGSFFASRTKPRAKPAPLALLRDAGKRFDVSTVAIGGITLANASNLIKEGADMVAVVRDVWDQDDPVAQVRAYSRLFA